MSHAMLEGMAMVDAGPISMSCTLILPLVLVRARRVGAVVPTGLRLKMRRGESLKKAVEKSQG